MRQGYLSLAKVELHAHLGGSARHSTLKELLITKYGTAKGSELAESVLIPKCDDGVQCEPQSYRGFALISEAYDSLELVKQLTLEFLEDCAADGVFYVELRTGGSSKEKLEAVLSAMDHYARINQEIHCNLILSIKREGTIEEAWVTVRNAVEYKNRGANIIAVDFCGVNPLGSPFNSDFAAAVKYAQDAGLVFIPHFGEAKGEPDLAVILDANPVRLGHGIWMDEHSKQRVYDSKIPIECCLTSNLNVMRRDGYIPPVQSVHEAIRKYHPVAEWHNLNHPFALSTDNVALLGVALSEIYQLAAEALCPNESDQAATAWRWAYNAIDMIRAGEDVKLKLRNRLDAHPWKPQ